MQALRRFWNDESGATVPRNDWPKVAASLLLGLSPMSNWPGNPSFSLLDVGKPGFNGLNRLRDHPMNYDGSRLNFGY
jgi:hypothetical protein